MTIKATTGNVGIGTTDPLDVLHVIGDIRTSACASDGAGDVTCVDVAETFVAGEELEAGDVVAVSDGPASGVASSSYALVKTQGTDSTTGNVGTGAVGVISTAPAILIEGNQSRLGGPKVAGTYAPGSKAPLALVGRVPVKVSDENGAVAAGDRLTASKTLPGYAMKQTEAGMSIGVALEGLNGEATSASGRKVLAFINLGYWVPDASNLAQNEAENASWMFDIDILFNSIVAKLAEIYDIILEKGVIRVVAIFAQKGQFDKVELKDEDTGEIHCVKIKGGVLLAAKGECGANGTSPQQDSNIGTGTASSGAGLISNETLTETASPSEETLVEEPIEEAPVVDSEADTTGQAASASEEVVTESPSPTAEPVIEETTEEEPEPTPESTPETTSETESILE